MAKKYWQELQERGFGETHDQTVCLECVWDDGLRSQLAQHVTEMSCSFCGMESEDEPVGANFEELMHLVMDAIYFLYERSSESLFWSDDVTPRRDSASIAYEVCDGAMTSEVVEAVADIIDHDDWNENPGALRPDVALISAWEDFREKVKHETRFVFLSIPEEHSDHPDEFTTSETLHKLMEIVQTRGAITEVPAGQAFYRGRMIANPEAAKGFGAAELGPPPSMIASANRMSPAGISMFYGSDNVATVIAEIGAHGIHRFAVVGTFETIRPLRLVDLSDLPPVPSIFSSEERAGYYELIFLHKFARDLSAPVELDGREHIDYVPTQVVTEYMRWLPENTVDGIIFTSSQTDGKSCVIFCGPDECVDAGQEERGSMLRLIEDSVRVLRVVSAPLLSS